MIVKSTIVLYVVTLWTGDIDVITFLLPLHNPDVHAKIIVPAYNSIAQLFLPYIHHMSHSDLLCLAIKWHNVVVTEHIITKYKLDIEQKYYQEAQGNDQRKS